MFLALMGVRPAEDGLQTTVYWVEVIALGVGSLGATGSLAGAWMQVT